MIDKAMKRALEPVPTVFPTEEEFNDPIVFLSSPRIQKLGDKYGMIKIKPPSSWKPPFSIDESSFRFKPRVQKLSELSLLNRIRTIFKDGLVNFMKMKKKKIPKTLYILLSNKEKMYYYDLFLKLNHYISSNFEKIDKDRKKNDTNGRNTVYNEIRNYPQIWKKLNSYYNLGSKSTEIGDFYNDYMKEYCIFLAKKYSSKIASFTEGDYQFNHNPYNESDEEDEAEDEDGQDEDEFWCHVCGEESDDEHTLLCDGCNKGYHTYCLTPAIRKIPRGSWYCDGCLVGTGEYGFVTSNVAYSLEEFRKLNEQFKGKYFNNVIPSSERGHLQKLSLEYLNDEIAEQEYVDFLENEFWENLVNNDQSNIKVNYGADIHNIKPGQISGFPMNYPFKEKLKDDFYINHSFNLTKLPFAHGSLLNHLNGRISGMTIPWLYIGSLFSTFCWHLEDHYMLSANYCHAGDIKKWYCIPESNCHQFEVLMKELAPDMFLRQPDLLHQLVTLLSPFDILKHNVKCYYANQKPGEFIITFPKCYHAGFNCGFNINEAVNFTNNEWLKFGINALDDYKIVKKPPVFNQIQLCYSILFHFLNEFNVDSKEYHRLVLKDNKMTESDYNLIIMCIAYLEKNLRDYTETWNQLKNRFSRLSIEQDHDLDISESSFNIRDIQNLDKFYNYSADKEKGQLKDSDKEDVICSVCQELCCMAWIELFDKKKIPVKAEELKREVLADIVESDIENKIAESHLPTPEPSPESRKRVSFALASEQLNNNNKRMRMSSPVMTIAKENVLHFCIEDFNKIFTKKGLKRNQDFKVWVRLGDDKLEKIIFNSKLKLGSVRVK